MSKPKPNIDFDHHSKEFAQDPASVFRRLHRECPVAWTEKYGGFWVISKYEDMKQVAQDDFTFSSRHDADPEGNSYTGIIIPPATNVIRAIPIETDPPEFYEYRRILNRRFSPENIEKLKPKVLEYTTACLDRVIETGRIDLVLDLANPVPAMATLELLGLPVERWEEFAEPIHAISYTPPESPKYQDTVDGMMKLMLALYEVLEERKRAPQDDLVSSLIEARFSDRPLSDQEIVEICILTISGGVDTTTSLIACALHYLDQNLEARRQLIENPGSISMAMEEFLRVFTPVQALARTATKDTEIRGRTIHAGERLLVCWGAANRDPDVFEKPDEIILDRFPNRHASFGLGAHRCVGSSFARAEIECVLGEVLRRIPDYRLVAEEAEKYETIGTVNGFVKLPATFTPGQRSDAVSKTVCKHGGTV